MLSGKEWRMALKGSRFSVGLGTWNKRLHQSDHTSALGRAHSPSSPTLTKHSTEEGVIDDWWCGAALPEGSLAWKCKEDPLSHER